MAVLGALVAISIATAVGWQLRLIADQRTAAIALTGCHTIKGVSGARGLVGPPLSDIASRVYVGGTLVSTPENLVSWIVDPRIHNPRTAMR